MDSTVFQRDNITWLSYALITFFAFFEASIGPVIPFIQEQLNLSHSIAGAHMSLFAVGIVFGSWASSILTRKHNRQRIIFVFLLLFSVSIISFTISLHFFITLSASFFMGTFGAIIFAIAQAVLSVNHGIDTSTAITEANIFASIGTTMLPIIIGLAVYIGTTWRGAFYFSVFFFTSLSLFFFSRAPIPESRMQNINTTEEDRLPFLFWLIWVLLFMGVAIEWGIVFWAANYMRLFLNIPTEQSSALMSMLFFGMVFSRFIMSRLTRFFNTQPLLLAITLLTTIGLFLFWKPSIGIINIFGLFLTGAGIANFYPLIISLGFTTVQANPDIISARLSSSVGAAIFSVPFLLGFIADLFNLQNAFLIIFFLLAIIFGFLILLITLQRKKISCQE
ncbi:MAG: MFS transporter [Spirochaetia bacterium]